jgi:hypothetical protein
MEPIEIEGVKYDVTARSGPGEVLPLYEVRLLGQRVIFGEIHHHDGRWVAAACGGADRAVVEKLIERLRPKLGP